MDENGGGWMSLGGIDDVSVCNLENELPKQKARANREREREREVRRSSEEGSEANINITTSNPKTLVRPVYRNLFVKFELSGSLERGTGIRSFWTRWFWCIVCEDAI
jgi:hypothetical protein